MKCTMRSKKNSRELNTDVFFRLLKVFELKSWEIEDDDSNELSLFNRFSLSLSQLTLEQQLLVLELTERFIRVPMKDYQEHIKIILKKIVEDELIDLSKISTIHIAPLIAPDDVGKVKSSILVQYSFNGVLNYYPNMSRKKYIYTTGLEVNSDQFNNEESILFLVDDFIGTGETACLALDYLINVKKVDPDKIIVLSIAALSKGVVSISKLNVIVYTSILINKGISDYYSADEGPLKLETMKSIEDNIKIHKNESFGYKQSEALITLIRTPNNTFPVFWKEKKGKIAPFPRY